MTIELEAMAIEMPGVSRSSEGSASRACCALAIGPCGTARPDRSPHPNRLPFRGVLTLLDTPSDQPPQGAREHRVLLTREAAEQALPSLLGMALDYTPALDAHDAKRKVGIITSAEIVESSALGRRSSVAPSTSGPTTDGQRPATVLEVSGYLFAKDFPEVVRELRRNASRLGMSYEISDARVENVRAAVWTLTEVTFTGAAILRREKAAYRETWIELEEPSAVGPRPSVPATPAEAHAETINAEILMADDRRPSAEDTRRTMNENELQDLINRLAAAAEAMERTVSAVHAQHDALSVKIDRIVAAVDESVARHELEARLTDLERANTELKAQLERRPVERKTLPPLVTALLSKNGIEDVHARIDTALLDKMLGSLAVDQRIAVKAQMAEAGIIE